MSNDATGSSETTSAANVTKSKAAAKRKGAAKTGAKAPNKAKLRASADIASQAKYPRHSVQKALRIPRAILEQNAGKPCTDREAANFVKVTFAGPFKVELSSALKYGLLERPQSGQVAVTDLARKILRPHNPSDELDGLREAILKAPDISTVYLHYRGENLPEAQFFQNALVDKFRIPTEKVTEFIAIFIETLQQAKLVEEHNGKARLLDVSQEGGIDHAAGTLKKLSRDVKVTSSET